MKAIGAVKTAKQFNYDAAAELYPARGRKTCRQFAAYQRFERAADAIRFAIEDLPTPSLLGAYLEVEERRFDNRDMRRLYDCAGFPLIRHVAG